MLTPFMPLHKENYQRGFLIDDHWMAGVADDPDFPGCFLAYVVDHPSGEMISTHRFNSLEEALRALQRLNRRWVFQSTQNCGDDGCSGEKCGPDKCKREACSIYRPQPERAST